jgi:pimeloyl-ACP methyl ester carboxylesterase
MGDLHRASTAVATEVGTLQVESIGAGPPAVLWHSLFVDSRSWHRVVEELAHERRLVLITGPGHGSSGDPGHHYTMEDCAAAAASILDALGIEEPVDWVGNAWGGHVGIVLAARQPQRLRTLTTVGTPVHSYTLRGRAETQALLAIHRLFGPTRFLRDSIAEALLSGRTRAQDQAAVDLVKDCFTNADRDGLRNAVVSISLRRPDLGPLLPSIEVPTLFVTGSDHRDWTPALARNASRLLRQGDVSVLDGAAYLGPLETPREFISLVRHFWASHPPLHGHQERLAADPSQRPPE